MPLPRRPGDLNQRAKMIVDLATGETTQEEIDKLPPMGREISAQARNASLSPERRREISALARAAKAKKRASLAT